LQTPSKGPETGLSNPFIYFFQEAGQRDGYGFEELYLEENKISLSLSQTVVPGKVNIVTLLDVGVTTITAATWEAEAGGS
jgi:hypothetical protein